ncbi:hypothetical protein HDU93_003957 [Gonapodya sp. JEL0774]|nr:hypothetical protein HDU93_003957 [Gonapodya sp. JEL0774]
MEGFDSTDDDVIKKDGRLAVVNKGSGTVVQPKNVAVGENTLYDNLQGPTSENGPTPITLSMSLNRTDSRTNDVPSEGVLGIHVSDRDKCHDTGSASDSGMPNAGFFPVKPGNSLPTNLPGIFVPDERTGPAFPPDLVKDSEMEAEVELSSDSDEENAASMECACCKVDRFPNDLGVRPDHFFEPHGMAVFRPTGEQFKDFETFLKAVEPWGIERGGIKIIAPESYLSDMGRPCDYAPLRLSTFRLRTPITQHFSGRHGVYRQLNMETRRREWSFGEFARDALREVNQPPGIDYDVDGERGLRGGKKRMRTEDEEEHGNHDVESDEAGGDTESDIEWTPGEEPKVKVRPVKARRQPVSRRGRGGQSKSIALGRRAKVEGVNGDTGEDYRCAPAAIVGPDALGVSEDISDTEIVDVDGNQDASIDEGERGLAVSPLTCSEIQEVPMPTAAPASPPDTGDEKHIDVHNDTKLDDVNVSGEQKGPTHQTTSQSVTSPQKRKKFVKKRVLPSIDNPEVLPPELLGTIFTLNERYDEEKEKDLERHYWRNLSYGTPTYGADQQGTVFERGKGGQWNLSRLENILRKINVPIPGITSPYVYFGMWKATFAWHLEDVDLYSINYLHFGAPKTWYFVPPAHKERLERLAQLKIDVRGLFGPPMTPPPDSPTDLPDLVALGGASSGMLNAGQASRRLMDDLPEWKGILALPPGTFRGPSLPTHRALLAPPNNLIPGEQLPPAKRKKISGKHMFTSAVAGTADLDGKFQFGVGPAKPNGTASSTIQTTPHGPRSDSSTTAVTQVNYEDYLGTVERALGLRASATGAGGGRHSINSSPSYPPSQSMKSRMPTEPSLSSSHERLPAVQINRLLGALNSSPVPAAVASNALKSYEEGLARLFAQRPVAGGGITSSMSPSLTSAYHTPPSFDWGGSGSVSQVGAGYGAGVSSYSHGYRPMGMVQYPGPAIPHTGYYGHVNHQMRAHMYPLTGGYSHEARGGSDCQSLPTVGSAAGNSVSELLAKLSG